MDVLQWKGGGILSVDTPVSLMLLFMVYGNSVGMQLGNHSMGTAVTSSCCYNSNYQQQTLIFAPCRSSYVSTWDGCPVCHPLLIPLIYGYDVPSTWVSMLELIVTFDFLSHIFFILISLLFPWVPCVFSLLPRCQGGKNLGFSEDVSSMLFISERSEMVIKSSSSILFIVKYCLAMIL